VFSRLVKTQLAVFAVLTVFGMTTVATNYLQWGADRYTVVVDFADVSGLYPQASVTYLGVDIGRVMSVELTDDGVRARLAIQSDTPISDQVLAEVHSTSAIGEQYVDLSPTTSDGGLLTDGSVIPRSRSRSLPPASDLLTSLDRLAASIPGDRLSAVLTEVTSAFQGAGGELGDLLDSASLLVHEASSALGPTTGLIASLGPFLDTQHDLDGQLRSFTKDLASFTDQLRYSDADLRRLIDSGPGLRDELIGLEGQLHPSVAVLLGNLVSSGEVVRTYLPGVEQILVLYPALSAAIQRTLRANADSGAIGNVLRLNVNDPPPCTTGYPSTSQRRDPSDTSQTSTDANLYCKVAPGDPRVVRGARNTPCLNAPGRRGASPSDCLAAKPDVPATYDSTSGRFISPTGGLYVLGGNQEGDLRWQKLMMK